MHSIIYNHTQMATAHSKLYAESRDVGDDTEEDDVEDDVEDDAGDNAEDDEEDDVEDDSAEDDTTEENTPPLCAHSPHTLDHLLRQLATFLGENQASLTSKIVQKHWRQVGQSDILEWVMPRKKQADKLHIRREKLLQLQHIDPPQTVKNILKRCRSNFNSIIEARQSTIDFQALSAQYIQLSKRGKGPELSILRRRLLLESFYLDAGRTGWYDGKVWLRDKKHLLAEKIFASPDVTDGIKVVKTSVSKYVELGRSFHIWAKHLGGSGYLLLLPLGVSEGSYV